MRNIKNNPGGYIRPEMKVIEIGPQFSVLNYDQKPTEEDDDNI